MLEPQKLKKLQEYAGILADQGQACEKAGENENAVKAYIKLVDVLLLLARESGDHATWSQYTRQAESYQNKAKTLIPPDMQGLLKATSKIPPPPSPGVPISTNSGPKQHSASPQQRTSRDSSAESVQKVSTFKKILRPFQKVESTQPGLEKDQQPTATAQIPMNQGKPESETPPIPTSQQDEEGRPDPREQILEQTIAENKKFREKLEQLLNERNARIASLEKEIESLNERLTTMVPKDEYDAVKSQLLDSISKPEFERLRTDLLNSVPRHEFADLVNRLGNTVPRELFIASELKISRLEAELEDMIPKKVLDDLATEILLLAALATIPLMEDQSIEEVKGEQKSQ